MCVLHNGGALSNNMMGNNNGISPTCSRLLALTDSTVFPVTLTALQSLACTLWPLNTSFQLTTSPKWMGSVGCSGRILRVEWRSFNWCRCSESCADRPRTMIRAVNQPYYSWSHSHTHKEETLRTRCTRCDLPQLPLLSQVIDDDERMMHERRSQCVETLKHGDVSLCRKH